jgi:hypothetical protein
MLLDKQVADFMDVMKSDKALKGGVTTNDGEAKIDVESAPVEKKEEQQTEKEVAIVTEVVPEAGKENSSAAVSASLAVNDYLLSLRNCLVFGHLCPSAPGMQFLIVPKLIKYFRNEHVFKFKISLVF